MGKSESKAVDSNTEFVNHKKFNEVHMVTEDDQKYIQIQVPVHSERQVQEWEKGQKELSSFNKQNLLLEHRHSFQKEGLCGSTGIVKILYENYPYLLTDEIYNRKGLSKLFDQSEIWYLLYTAVSAAKDFQSLSKKLGDIRPDNIFINEDGQVKLANVHSWPNEDDNYMKTLLNNEATYLAPEEVRELQNGKSQSGPNCDPNIAEAFSIGLTIIDAGLLGDCSKIYNFKANRFDQEKARSIFREWSESQYSDFLKRTVLSLVELDPKARQSPEAVYQKLLPHEDDIKNLREFATSTQGSPNRATAPQPYRPAVARNYAYEGPVLVKSQLVSEPKAFAPVHHEAERQSVDRGAPAVTFTTGQGQPTYISSAYTATAPSSSYSPAYIAPAYTTGASTGIGALNPQIPTSTAGYSGPSQVAYQYPYQPTRVVTQPLSSVAPRSYQTSIPAGSSYTTSSYTGSQPVVYITGQPIYSGSSSIPGANYTTTYSGNYNPTGPTATTSSYQPGYAYTTLETAQPSNAGTTSPQAGSGALSGSTSKNTNPQLTETFEKTTTITRIVNGQPVTTTTEVRSSSTQEAEARKDLSSARQVDSIVPPAANY